MSKYEMTVVIGSKVADEDRDKTLQSAKDLVARFGGTDLAVDEWGKRHLAYEIAKNRDGYYYFIQFDAPETAPEEIESRMRIMDNVLRYLIVKLDPKELARQDAIKTRVREKAEATAREGSKPAYESSEEDVPASDTTDEE